MPSTTVDGVRLRYEIVGEGPGWVVTPGGRYSMDSPGVRELAAALAAGGRSALVWDRPNCGGSGVRFDGDSESAMQADALAGLLRHLDLAPAVLAGGSGGARVSLLTAARHPDTVAGLALWWISGGHFGLMSIAMHYCGPSLRAAWQEGMDAVADLDDWREVIAHDPANRDRIVAQDRDEFVATMERWMAAYLPRDDELVPGLTHAEARRLDLPALVFRSGASDLHHRRETSEEVAATLPNARLVEPPWPDTEWHDRQAKRDEGLFARWPLLAPQLLEWEADTVDRAGPQ